ncbi:MAG TPA: hypothetical protein VGL61_10355 [Kofleriaceae bacterium]|jgi:hypothetical protein
MKTVVIAACALVGSFALAIGCHESQPGTTPMAQPQPVATAVVPDAAPPLIDSPGPMGADPGQGEPGTNQP